MSVNIADRDLIEDPHEFEEPEEFTLRQYLGLRPITLVDDGMEGTHPDRRPCPPWCDLGNSEHGHSVEPSSPYAAEHSSVIVSLAASHYEGSAEHSAGQRFIAPATIECWLRQSGQGDTTIKVSLRHDGGGPKWQERLRLSVNDARDLIATLTYLVGLTEYDR